MLFSPRNLLQQHGPYIKKVEKKICRGVCWKADRWITTDWWHWQNGRVADSYPYLHTRRTTIVYWGISVHAWTDDHPRLTLEIRLSRLLDMPTVHTTEEKIYTLGLSLKYCQQASLVNTWVARGKSQPWVRDTCIDHQPHTAASQHSAVPSEMEYSFRNSRSFGQKNCIKRFMD